MPPQAAPAPTSPTPAAAPCQASAGSRCRAAAELQSSLDCSGSLLSSCPRPHLIQPGEATTWRVQVMPLEAWAPATVAPSGCPLAMAAAVLSTPTHFAHHGRGAGRQPLPVCEAATTRA
jgi:hypothetical protein